MDLWLMVLALGVTAVYAVDYECYEYSTEDNNKLAKREKEKQVCESYENHTYTAGFNNQYPGCGACHCCTIKGCYTWTPKQHKGTWGYTRTGLECQRWDAQEPHQHTRNLDKLFKKDGGVQNAENYCRDPDNSGYLWCYTTDPQVRYQSCDISKCSAINEFKSDCYQLTTADLEKLDATEEVPTESGLREVCESYIHHTWLGSNADNSTCGAIKCSCCQERGCFLDSPRTYRGTFALTRSGRACQRWDSQVPHKHKQEEKNFPEDMSLYDAHNYCRDPDGEGFLWCYTIDEKKRFESCDIFQCLDQEQGNGGEGEDEGEEPDLTVRPAFSVFMNKPLATGTNTADDIVRYDTVIMNDGRGYCAESGRFKAPVDGVYFLTFTAGGISDAVVKLELHVDGVRATEGVVGGQGETYTQGGNTVIIHMKKGSGAWVKVDTTNYSSPVMGELRVNTFSGYLLSRAEGNNNGTATTAPPTNLQ